MGLNHRPLDWQSSALPRDHRSPLRISQRKCLRFGPVEIHWETSKVIWLCMLLPVFANYLIKVIKVNSVDYFNDITLSFLTKYAYKLRVHYNFTRISFESSWQLNGTWKENLSKMHPMTPVDTSCEIIAKCSWTNIKNIAPSFQFLPWVMCTLRDLFRICNYQTWLTFWNRRTLHRQI